MLLLLHNDGIHAIVFNGPNANWRFAYVFVCMFVCVCVRARVHVRVHVRVPNLSHSGDCPGPIFDFHDDALSCRGGGGKGGQCH